jgi:hypothetical protein
LKVARERGRLSQYLCREVAAWKFKDDSRYNGF